MRRSTLTFWFVCAFTCSVASLLVCTPIVTPGDGADDTDSGAPDDGVSSTEDSGAPQHTLTSWVVLSGEGPQSKAYPIRHGDGLVFFLTRPGGGDAGPNAQYAWVQSSETTDAKLPSLVERAQWESVLTALHMEPTIGSDFTDAGPTPFAIINAVPNRLRDEGVFFLSEVGRPLARLGTCLPFSSDIITATVSHGQRGYFLSVGCTQTTCPFPSHFKIVDGGTELSSCYGAAYNASFIAGGTHPTEPWAYYVESRPGVSGQLDLVFLDVPKRDDSLKRRALGLPREAPTYRTAFVVGQVDEVTLATRNSDSSVLRFVSYGRDGGSHGWPALDALGSGTRATLDYRTWWLGPELSALVLSRVSPPDGGTPSGTRRVLVEPAQALDLRGGVAVHHEVMLVHGGRVGSFLVPGPKQARLEWVAFDGDAVFVLYRDSSLDGGLANLVMHRLGALSEVFPPP